MYKLIFKTHTIKCKTLKEWHKTVVKLEKRGLMYTNYKKALVGYEFYYE